MKNPIMVAMKTITERSLLLMIPIIPVKKEDMPQIPAKSIGIAIARLLKNVGISSLRCPDPISISMANRKKTGDPTINPIDHFPRAVLGRIQ